MRGQVRGGAQVALGAEGVLAGQAGRRQLAAEGRSVIFVSSEIEELPLVCDRVLVLREGKLMEEFTLPDIDQDAVMAACIAGH